MGLYTFTHIDDDGVEVSVRLSDQERCHISAVLSAFQRFLLGVTFHPETIEKYIDVNKVNTDQFEQAIGR